MAKLPEMQIQDEIVTYLRREGYIVLRVGQNGLPDIFALEPEELGKTWFPGKKNDFNETYYIPWSGAMRMNGTVAPHGLHLGTVRPWTKLAIEVKKGGGGERSPRQEAIIHALSNYACAGFASSVDDVCALVSSARGF